MNERNSVTWKWLAGILVLILLGAGGGWMGSMHAQIEDLKKEQSQDRAAVGQVDKKVGIIEEQTKRTQDDVKEIKETQKDTNRKLDELLRRR